MWKEGKAVKFGTIKEFLGDQDAVYRKILDNNDRIDLV